MSNETATLSGKLKAVLKSKGVPLKALASELGIPYRSMQNYVNGETRIPADVFLEICNYIGIEADYFQYGDFKVMSSELYSAVFYALDDLGLLPDSHIERDGYQVVAEDNSARKHLSMLAAKLVLERYDRYREEWLKRRDGPTGGPRGIRDPVQLFDRPIKR